MSLRQLEIQLSTIEVFLWFPNASSVFPNVCLLVTCLLTELFASKLQEHPTQFHFLQGYAEAFPLVVKIKMFDASSMLIPGGTSI